MDFMQDGLDERGSKKGMVHVAIFSHAFSPFHPKWKGKKKRD